MVQASRPRDNSLVPGGEFAMSWSDFRQIAQLVHAGAGIALTESKVNLVYSRLAKRLRAAGLKSFRDYCELISSSDGADERQAMIAALTTNVTRFFRESHHFEHVREHVLPRLAARALAGGRVRLWSAGCSSGEEPYSLALTMLDVIPDAAEQDVLVLASDIDPAMLAHAERGVYRATQLEDIPLGSRHNRVEMIKSGTEMSFRIGDQVREIVRFRELNLLGSWPMTGKFDAIFCRNVMIYFDEATQRRLCERFADILSENGMLYIGHSERIGADLPFDLVTQTGYRVRKGIVR
jgi:chemotaxis protein methyltransferase CheR